MKLEKRIYCIEGIHNWGARDIEPTIEPMLQMLSRGVGIWKVLRRDCATEGELKWYLQNEWWNRCREGSVLYFCSHGSPAAVCLSEGADCDLGQLALLLESGGCANCHVHFGGCNTLRSRDAVQDFMTRTGAWSVSGYHKASDWTGIKYNGPALEYAFFSSISGTKQLDEEKPIEIGGEKVHKNRLREIGNSLGELFPDLGFEILTS